MAQQLTADNPAHAFMLAGTQDTTATFAEHEDLKAILRAGRANFDVEVICEVPTHRAPFPQFPVFTASIGSRDPKAPAVGFFGGIHGLERIGTQVILHYMRALIFRLEWDELLHQQLEKVRLIFMPIVNPGGMWAHKRANPNGVDLMRNAPQRAESSVPFLAGGQTLTPLLPWYCGQPGAPMQLESAALLRVVSEQLSSRPFSLALDCHSGYGFDDSIWFPYAKTRRLMAHLPEMFALKTMLEQSHPHHAYSFEPQSNQYLLHGDLWDHAYDAAPAGNVFLPMTLELGSWLWIRKNPRQLFSRHGIFNPIKEHRIKRVLRRHADLLDFLTRAAFAAPRWLPPEERRSELQRLAATRSGMVAAKATHMTWILLRGLTREARHWGGFTGQLATNLGQKVLALDLPGSGEFFCETSPAAVRGIVDTVRRQLQAGGARPPFALMGMSMGGMVAADWAQQYPNEISQLVLINTSMRPFSRLSQRLWPRNWLAIARVALRWRKADQAAAIEGVIHQLTCNQVVHRSADLAAWLDIRDSAPVSAANAVRQLLAAAKFSYASSAPHCPVLVLSSAKDQLVNPLCSTQLATAWKVPHHQHETAGHDLPHDDSAWLCQQLASWLILNEKA